MSRMIDRLRLAPASAFGYATPRDADPRIQFELEAMMHGLVDSLDRETLQVIVCDNVTEYIYAQNPKEKWHPADFPTPRAPFAQVWVETTRPSRILSGRKALSTREFPGAWGCLVGTESFANITAEYPEANLGDLQSYLTADPETFMLLVPILEFGPGRDYRWPGAQMVVPLDRDGQPCVNQHVFMQPLGPGTSLPVEMAEGFFYPILMALSLMNCRNVVTVEEAPPERLAHAHLKRRGRPLVSFRTIRVAPAATRRVGPHGAPGGHRDLPLHVVRGHFKHFSPEAPLLGKHAGTFWWPAFARGREEHGEVDHEYLVEAAT